MNEPQQFLIPRSDGGVAIFEPSYLDSIRALVPGVLGFELGPSGWRVTLDDGTLAEGVTATKSDISLADGSSIFAESQADFEARVVQKKLFSDAKQRGELTAADFPAGYFDNRHMNTANFKDYIGAAFPLPRPRSLDEPHPSDRYFREAWVDNGTNVVTDMPKARGMQMDYIRRVRDAELKRLDLEVIKTIEAKGDVAPLAAQKQTLRDIPQTFDLTTDPDEPEQLKAKWPDELPARE